jgi:hypothetical protein
VAASVPGAGMSFRIDRLVVATTWLYSVVAVGTRSSSRSVSDGGWSHSPRHCHGDPDCGDQRQSCAFRRRSAFRITDTELNVIAALAQMGLMSRPITG